MTDLPPDKRHQFHSAVSARLGSLSLHFSSNLLDPHAEVAIVGDAQIRRIDDRGTVADSSSKAGVKIRQRRKESLGSMHIWPTGGADPHNVEVCVDPAEWRLLFEARLSGCAFDLKIIALAEADAIPDPLFGMTYEITHYIVTLSDPPSVESK